MQEWNCSFSGSWTEHALSLAYVGTKGTHLTTYFNYNRQNYDTAQLLRELSRARRINTQALHRNLDLQRLEVAVEPPHVQRAAVRQNYTWSHAIDDSPGAFDKSGR